MTSDAATRPKLVLASGSARRLQLLQQVGIEPDALMPADIDETPLKNELPRTLAARLSAEKARNALKIVDTRPELSGSYLLSADTVVAVGRRILPKPEIGEEIEFEGVPSAFQPDPFMITFDTEVAKIKGLKVQAAPSAAPHRPVTRKKKAG